LVEEGIIARWGIDVGAERCPAVIEGNRSLCECIQRGEGDHGSKKHSLHSFPFLAGNCAIDCDSALLLAFGKPES
jgi:hypothetical protein